MDTLAEGADRVDDALAGLLQPWIDQESAIVFYGLTTIRAEGSTDEPEDLRHVGHAKKGETVCQVMLGVIQTAEGLPIHHEVFAGTTGETTTLVPTIEKVLARYPIKRVVLVADRGLPSLDNLDAIRALRVGDQPLEFILAVPARRYGDFDSLLAPFHTTACRSATEEVFGELDGQGFRLIVAHCPDRASEQSRVRDEHIAAREADAPQWAETLDAQDASPTRPGKKLSDAGTIARFYKAVADAHLAHIIQVNLASEVFTYEIDERALKRARLLDGKLILISNVPESPPTEIVARDKALADIERGFRVLKSEIGIAPVFHGLPDRIRAHALICFLALLLYRVLSLRLKAKASPLVSFVLWLFVHWRRV